MKRVVVAVVSGALLAGVGMGVGVAAGGGGESARSRVHPAVAAVNDTAVESSYTPVAVCRPVDSAAIGDVLAPNATRNYRAAGTTGFAGQGGKNGGCAVPDAATAVQVVVTAVGASGKGSLRAAAVGALPGPLLNYTASFDVTGSGVVALSGGRFRLQNLTASTSVRVDVQGYFVPPIWAQVRSDGVLVAGSRIVSVTRLDVGRYEVTADRDVSGCGVQAQSTGLDQSDIWLQAIDAVVTVDVESPATANSQDDDAFYLTITC